MQKIIKRLSYVLVSSIISSNGIDSLIPKKRGSLSTHVGGYERNEYETEKI